MSDLAADLAKIHEAEARARDVDAAMSPVERVVRAWTVEGPVPSYHRAWQERVRKEWPALGSALDALDREMHPGRRDR